MKMTFKRALIIAFVVTLPLMAPSCIKHVSYGDPFVASFVLNTKTFFDGDEFSFTVKSNHENLRVVDFSFPLQPELVKVGQVYSAKGGEWTVSKAVSVEDNRRGKLSISVEDVSTGEVLSFTETFTAYRRTKVSIEILNPALKRTGYVDDEFPTIIDGDDFKIRIRSSIERIRLTAFKCALNDGTLKEGTEYEPNSDGEVFITIPTVTVTSDNLKTPYTLSMTFEDPDTGETTVAEAYFYTCLRFNVSAEITPNVIHNGDDLVLTISSNRDKFRYNSSTKLPWFNPLIPTSVALTADKVYTVSIPSVNITSSSEGDISFSFTDDQYTSEEKIVKLHYVATADMPPSSIKVSENNITVNELEFSKLIVTTDDQYSTNKFHVSTRSGASNGLLFYAPESDNYDTDKISDSSYSSECDITNNVLLIKAVIGGKYTIRISSYGRENVYKDVEVIVKKNVAVVLQGSFYDHMGGVADNQYGYFGLPRVISAQLMAYQPKDKTKPKELSDFSDAASLKSSFDFVPINANGNHRVNMKVEFGSQVSSKSFYYIARHFYKDNTDEENVDYFLWWGFIYEIYSRTYPEESNRIHYTQDSTFGDAFIECTNLTEYMADINLKASIRSIKDASDGEELKYGSIKISLSDYSFSIDKDAYNINYVVNLITYNPGGLAVQAWWAPIDISPLVTRL